MKENQLDKASFVSLYCFNSGKEEEEGGQDTAPSSLHATMIRSHARFCKYLVQKKK